MKKLLLALFAGLFLFTGVIFAQDANKEMSKAIGKDPNVTIGKLDNGLTYYLRKNKKPENRIEFRLAVNAGSILEDEDQRGLAHFTEHMAFNGIEGYPGNTMISELQKIGVIFGMGINAYTGFDETVFMITMPADDQKYIDMGINILYGWAHGLLYADEEIEAERGVISEEYRMGQGADDRMRKKWFPVVFNNSRYAERLPIGLIEIIQGFKPEVIKRFYNDWYRPDLQAIVVVGDFNMEAMEKQVKEKFGSIPAKQNPRERVRYGIDNNKEPLVCVATDKENGSNTVMVFRKFPHEAMSIVQDYKDHMAQELFNMMYDSRLNELAQKPGQPFLGLSAGYGKLIGDIDAYTLYGSAKENQIIPTLQAMMREDYRVLRYGFLETELKRAKEEMLNNYERAAKEVDKTESAVFANEYVDNFLYKDPIPGAKRELNYANKYLESITLEEVNAWAKKWITEENMAVVVLAPEKEGVKVPTEAELLAVIKDKSLADVEPYVDTYKEQEIVEKETLKPGAIVSEKDIPEISATEYILSNGVRVVAKHTNFKNDQILFSAQSKGGMSLYYDCDVPSLYFASDLVDRAGIAELDYSSLEKKLKGKRISLSPNITAFTESLGGSAAPKDLDLFFQYINAFFTNPRKDTAVYQLVMDETKEQLKAMTANPMYQFFGALLDALKQGDIYQKSPLSMDDEYLSRVDYERAYYLYQERFANPADFNFYFVGNFDEAELKDLLCTYIASMPTTDKKEEINAKVFKSFPENTEMKKVYAGTEEQGWMGLALSEEMEWNDYNKLMVDVASEALQIEVTEIIREKLGGTYSPMLQMGASKLPTPSYIALILYSCDPNNIEKLSKATFDILTKFMKKGPKKETLAKVKEQMIRSAEEDQQTNSYWLSYIASQELYGDALDEYTHLKDELAPITTKQVAQWMAKNFKIDHYLRVDLYPETAKTK